MERAEINNDLTRNEPIREVRQTKDARTEETTKKKFVAELERRLSRKKKKDSKNEKDEIILHAEGDSDENENPDKDGKRKKRNKKGPVSSPEGLKGNEIDFLA
ncbi:MAG: hypothetical protein JSW64_08460 [Candidatus Zixiibacteriota bacterium]|nr:MAG: hypothetical protein JSW64_08460 [candidate division Zixibacteria bacterium]